MPSIEFIYDEVAGDLENIAATAANFLTPESKGRLKKAVADLRVLKGSPHKVVWRVGREDYQRLESASSIGECELGENVAWNVFGAVSFQWEIERVTAGRKAAFSVINASNLIRVFACDEAGVVTNAERPLASWRFEIASGEHPGAALHSQVNWPHADGERRFEIPRIPSTLLTPTEALDFLLGELFQKRWPEHCRITQGHWKSTQRSRLLKLLRKQMDEVNEASDLSAVMQLKAWKPIGLLSHG